MARASDGVIREAIEGDCEAVVALWRACELTRPWNDPDADFALALGNAGSTVFVSDAHDAIDGSVMVGFDGHRGWIYYLAVAQHARRSGLGRKLMAAAERWLRERGAPKMQLMVRDGNEAALGFYAALGMERQRVVTLGRLLKDEE